MYQHNCWINFFVYHWLKISLTNALKLVTYLVLHFKTLKFIYCSTYISKQWDHYIGGYQFKLSLITTMFTLIHLYYLSFILRDIHKKLSILWTDDIKVTTKHMELLVFIQRKSEMQCHFQLMFYFTPSWLCICHTALFGSDHINSCLQASVFVWFFILCTLLVPALSFFLALQNITYN